MVVTGAPTGGPQPGGIDHRPIRVPPRSFSAVSEVPDSQLPDSEGRTTETQRITQNLEAANSEVPC